SFSPQTILNIENSQFKKVAHGNIIELYRTLVAWFLNLISYTCLIIDIDVLIFSDISSFTQEYSNHDIIAGRDSLPTELAQAWGSTLCTEFIFIKPSEHIEEFWHTFQHMKSKKFDLQS
ncbi:hypothetical protein, partial [Salmonella sp. s51228]|uniref:hypothetical protein n=1 Tax=Salmonella sp. s51228 TaxID=3159652 RepID=UPI00397F1313